MIIITSGTVGTSKGIKTSKSGEVELPFEEEARLVNRGVAQYMTIPVLSKPEKDVATHGEDNIPDLPISDMADAKNATKECSDTTGSQNASHLDKEQLMTMSIADLRKLAADMGIDVSGLRKKADIVDALAVEAVYPGDDEEDVPPDLIAEDPIT